MRLLDFAEQIINGNAGFIDFCDREAVVPHSSIEVAVACWTIRCLANPDCPGSQEAIDAILAKRSEQPK